MPVKVIAPAASEPVSLAEAKLFLRVDHADEDSLIADLIGAARAAVEAGCGRALIRRRVRETLSHWRRLSSDVARLSLGPVSEVSAVRLLARSGTQSIIDPARYRLEDEAGRARIVFENGLPATLRSAGIVEVEYDAGFAEEASALPAALRIATLQVVASLYEARQGAALPAAARALISPFAPVRL